MRTTTILTGDFGALPVDVPRCKHVFVRENACNRAARMGPGDTSLCRRGLGPGSKNFCC